MLELTPYQAERFRRDIEGSVAVALHEREGISLSEAIGWCLSTPELEQDIQNASNDKLLSGNDYVQDLVSRFF